LLALSTTTGDGDSGSPALFVAADTRFWGFPSGLGTLGLQALQANSHCTELEGLNGYSVTGKPPMCLMADFMNARRQFFAKDAMAKPFLELGVPYLGE
jgi:hypothetical protein